MKKNFLFFILVLLCLNAKALQFTPEHYTQQAQILRNLDIEASYLSDMIFLEFKESSMDMHSKTLVDTMRILQNYSDYPQNIRKRKYSSRIFILSNCRIWFKNSFYLKN